MTATKKPAKKTKPVNADSLPLTEAIDWHLRNSDRHIAIAKQALKNGPQSLEGDLHGCGKGTPEECRKRIAELEASKKAFTSKGCELASEILEKLEWLTDAIVEFRRECGPGEADPFSKYTDVYNPFFWDELTALEYVANAVGCGIPDGSPVISPDEARTLMDMNG